MYYFLWSSYDSDNPRVPGDVGMAGVAIDSVEDMKVTTLVLDGSCGKSILKYKSMA